MKVFVFCLPEDVERRVVRMCAAGGLAVRAGGGGDGWAEEIAQFGPAVIFTDPFAEVEGEPAVRAVRKALPRAPYVIGGILPPALPALDGMGKALGVEEIIPADFQDEQLTTFLAKAKAHAAPTIADATEPMDHEKDLLERAERHLRHRRALSALTRRGEAAENDLVAECRRITEAMASALRVERVSIWRFSVDRQALQCMDFFSVATGEHSILPDLAKASYPNYFLACETEAVIDADDALADPRTGEMRAAYLVPAGIGAMLDAPIHLRERVEGVLCHEHVGSPRKWDGEEMNFVIAVANLVSLAMEREERRMAEVEMKKSQERFSIVARATTDIVWDFDLRSGELWWNENMSLLFGYTEAVSGGLGFWQEIIHPDDRHRVYQGFFRAIMGDATIWSDEYRLRRNDGSYASVFDRGYIIRGSDGMAERMIGAVLDFTARKRAEDDLRQQEQWFRSLIEDASDLITVVNRTGVILYQSPSSERITGYRPEHLIDRSFLHLIAPEQRAATLRRIFETAADDSPRTPVEFALCHRDGSRRTIESVARNMKARSDGGGVVIVSRDVTETRRLEGQLRQAQKMEAIGQLSAGVAHDFNNILTVIRGNVELMKVDRDLPPRLQETASEIVAAADQAAGLTQQLLAFGRRQSMRVEPVDVNDVVGAASRMLRRMVGEDIFLTVEKGGEPAVALVDVRMIDRILLNLAANARDAMPVGGQLIIRVETVGLETNEVPQGVEPGGNWVRITVADSGMGIPPDILSRVFDPFFTTKEVGRGTGLGLATVYGLMQQHGGWVEASSHPGRGAEFRLFFPRYRGTLSARGTRSDANPLPRGNGETILLVEDESTVRELVRTILTQLGYEVLDARSGTVALEIWRQHQDRVQLLLSDLVMPDGISGLDLHRRLSKDREDLAVVFMSGYSHQFPGRDDAIRPGENFLSKPFQPADLARMVHYALVRRS